MKKFFEVVPAPPWLCSWATHKDNRGTQRRTKYGAGYKSEMTYTTDFLSCWDQCSNVPRQGFSAIHPTVVLYVVQAMFNDDLAPRPHRDVRLADFLLATDAKMRSITAGPPTQPSHTRVIRYKGHPIRDIVYLSEKLRDMTL